ncbi:MAG: DNA polymerase I [Clostridiaceae bacterium]|nr:DNA polymerase I [Clostridiaceae bacterium]
MSKDFFKKNKRKHLMLIDGNSLINRAYYASAGRTMLTAPDGTPSGAVYTFLNMLLNYQEKIQPDNILVAFDLAEKTFRHDMYDEYKGTRSAMPDDLAIQMPLLKEMLDALNISRAEKQGFEADDLIGTYAKIGAENDYDVYIVTGDKDSFQLIRDQIFVVLPVTRSGNTSEDLMDRETFFKTYHFQPEQFVDYKAIMGDSSDNIPGVKGIGKVGAGDLIENFSDLKNIYQLLEENPDEIPKKYQKKLLDAKETAILSHKLALINTNVAVDLDLEKTNKKEPDEKNLIDFFVKMGFQTMFERFNIKDNHSFFNKDIMMDQHEDISEFLQLTNLDEIIWLVSDAGESFIYSPNSGYLFLEPIEISANWQKFSDLPNLFIIWDYKNWLKNLGFGPLATQPFDTQMAAYLLNQGKAEDYSSVFQDVFHENFPILNKKHNKEELLEYFKKMAYSMSQLHLIQRQKIRDWQIELLYYGIEMPLIEVLSDMENTGVYADKDKLDELNKKMNAEIAQLEEKIYAYADEAFNINSSKQLSDVLFDHLGLKPGKKLASGYYSTAANELERLQGQHPIIDLIMEHRELSKLNSTFVDGLRKAINKNDNRIHTTYHQTLTTTGRLSSSNPNLQNIPVRSDRSKLIREVFIAKPDHVLLGADYSQIELRLLAHLSEDENLINAFKQNLDIHTNTAVKIFNKEPDDITSKERSLAKTVNFSIVYGVSAYGLSQDLKSSVDEAKSYIDAYYENYPKVKPYLESLISSAKENGYVETLYGRRRYIAELKSKQFFTRSFGERAAMNAPLQGTAADLIKLAMVKIHQKLKDLDYEAKIILQVHDELILEVPEKEINEVKKILQSEMENVVKLHVPLKVDIASGKSWAEI